jgi:epoxyqueuosine reductase
LGQLKHDIEKIDDKNHLSDSFYSFLKNCFDFTVPENIHNATSIIIAAVPSPRVRVFFNHKGERVPLFIPPTYVEMFSTSSRIISLLEDIPELHDYNVVMARLPEKLLAVRSGLGFYGKNNICYIPGMGSFVQLAAFYTDIPCQEDNWNDVKMMDACKNCFICCKRCPTGSISKEQIIINAEKCICYMNEHKGIFPDWVNLSWHNSIVGCLLCQEACPENKNVLKQIIDMGEFSERETEMLLNNEPLKSISSETKVKLEQLNMLVFYDCLSRNLKVLLDRAG